MPARTGFFRGRAVPMEPARCTVGVAFECDCGHTDHRHFCELSLQVVMPRFALHQIESPAVIVDDVRDMVWVVENRGAALEVASSRRELPDQLGEITSI